MSISNLWRLGRMLSTGDTASRWRRRASASISGTPRRDDSRDADSDAETASRETGCTRDFTQMSGLKSRVSATTRNPANEMRFPAPRAEGSTGSPAEDRPERAEAGDQA
ncbi:MAG TPA: hypothetical protein VM115_11305 [Vicinamibacterales bacterium]|nr:hypothetical protein [Vicinamibacterales bacterium]